MQMSMRAILLAASAAMIWSSASAETFVRMVAGPAGGTWYPLGAKIMEVLQKDVPGIRTSNGPGGGVANARKVNDGGAEMGFTFGFTAYDAYAGRDVFKEPNKNLRFFATLYPGVLQTAVPANSDIRSYADLKGKNFSPGKKSFSGNVTVERLLPFYDITYEQIKAAGGTIHRVGYSDSVALMKDRHIDAFVGLTSVPNSSFLDLEFSPGIRFLPVEDEVAKKFIEKNPGFWTVNIEPSAYKSLKEPVQTLATANVLVINKDLSDELVYKMTKAFWDNHAEIQKVHSSWKDVQLETALKAATIPLHPGAEKYYKEHGITLQN